MTKPPAEYGFLKLALVILMVVLVHFVEAYMLNPAIYSAALKLHPLMVSMHLARVVPVLVCRA
jgi:predicted PurR-regulated permease PerM